MNLLLQREMKSSILDILSYRRHGNMKVILSEQVAMCSRERENFLAMRAVPQLPHL
jgi:hypothetical protein